jgi:tripartite-type tricarboxylate transporter receptor subunit TctC
MRLLADASTKSLGQPIVVVNKPGAGGQTGLREVASSPPDGYTISMIATGFLSQQYANPNANVIDDYTIIAYVGTDAAALTTNVSTGWKTLADFTAAAKAKPKSIRNGNDQPGGSSYLAIALMERAMGVQVVRVPYAGDAPNVQALLSGEVQTSTAAITNMTDQHKAGKVRILAVAGDERDAKVPEVPTFKEQGVNLVAGVMRAIVAPKGLPADRLKKLESAILAGLNDPGFRQRAAAGSYGLSPKGSAEATKLVKQMDAEMYPVLLEADMVKVRKK